MSILIQILSIIIDVLTKRSEKRKVEAKRVRVSAVLKDGKVIKGKKETEIPPSERMPVMEQVAKDLGVETNLIKAFIEVESGKYHKYNGLLVINYEAHYFKRLSGVYIPDDNKIKGDVLNQKDEWRNFKAARAKNEEAAYSSISMGKTQIMGANYKILGYLSAKDMFTGFDMSEDNAIYGFGAFVKANKKLHIACKEKDYHRMAYYYNGPKYKNYKDSKGRTYADKIKESYERLCA